MIISEAFVSLAGTVACCIACVRLYYVNKTDPIFTLNVQALVKAHLIQSKASSIGCVVVVVWL